MCSLSQLIVVDSSLLEWLTNRHLINADWHSKFLIIKPLIESAWELSSEFEELYEYKNCLSVIDYFQAKKIFEIFSTKNRSKQIIKAWENVVVLYEKKDIFLAHSAYIYVNIKKIELKNNREKISKIDSQILNSNQLCAKYKRNSTTFSEKFTEHLDALNINLKDVEQSDYKNLISQKLMSSTLKIDDIFAEISRSVIALENPINYFYNFSKEVHGSQLRHIFPIFEFVMSPPKCETLTDKLILHTQINGDSGLTHGKNVFPLNIYSKIEFPNECPSISFMLEQTMFRTALVTEMLQLREFLRMRVEEECDSFLCVINLTVKTDRDIISRYISEVDNCITMMESAELADLIKLRHSDEYLTQRVIELLRLNESACVEMKSYELESARIEQLRQSRASIERKLDRLLVFRKQLHDQLEMEITLRCKTNVRIIETCFDVNN